ncbi:MAG: nitroreductase [Thermodesulfobacteriota bacterium]
MELDQAINQRHSVRQFLDRPVGRALIEEILTLAVRSPSWGNTQPWELAVFGGEAARDLTRTYRDLARAGVPANPDFPMPGGFSGEYDRRYRSVGREVFRLKGIARDDQQARLDHMLSNFSGFGAPNLVYILIDAALDTVYSVFDCGLLAAHLCLLAAARGLGTCLLAALTMYPDEVRKRLKLGPEKKVVLGLALGWPDPAAPINGIRTPREPLDRTVTWVEVD